ncbi:MAG: hypothetical protein ACYCZO_07255, partial [Daejeonella sp.]
MAKPLQIQLLELLEKEGLSKGIGISDFITSHFEKPDYNLIEHIGKDQDDAYNFIIELQDKKYANFNWN